MKKLLSLVLLTSLLSACMDPPHVAPAPPLVGTPIALKNPSFAADASGKLTDWQAHEHAGDPSYTFVADTAKPYSAPSSARIQRYGPQFFGVLDQRLRVLPEWQGKTVRLSGLLKTQGATGQGAGLLIKSTSGDGGILSHDFMNGRRLQGDRDWQPYSVDIKIESGAYFLLVGVILEDDGTLWADDLTLQLLD